MSNLTDRVAYLKGLAEGMKIPEDTNEGKLLLKMLEVMSEMADKISDLSDAQEELSDYVESIDDDLADMEEELFGDEGGCDCCHHGDDDFEDVDDDDLPFDEDDEDEDGSCEVNCPHCGADITFKVDMRKLNHYDQECLCPECGKPLFSESEE